MILRHSFPNRLPLALLLLFLHKVSSNTASDSLSGLSYQQCMQASSTSQICDLGQLLTQSDVSSINVTIVNKLGSIACTKCKSCETNPKLLVYAATIVSGLDNNNDTLCGLFEENFASNLRSNWSMSPCGHDILLLWSNCSDKMYLSSGASADLRLPLECQKVILSKVNGLSVSEAFTRAMEQIAELYRNPTADSFPPCFQRNAPLPTYVWVLIGLTVLLVVGFVVFLVYQCTAQQRRLYLNYHPENFTRFHQHNQDEAATGDGGLTPYNFDLSYPHNDELQEVPGAEDDWVGGPPGNLPSLGSNPYRQFHTEVHAVGGGPGTGGEETGNSTPYFVNPTYRG